MIYDAESARELADIDLLIAVAQVRNLRLTLSPANPLQGVLGQDDAVLVAEITRRADRKRGEVRA